MELIVFRIGPFCVVFFMSSQACGVATPLSSNFWFLGWMLSNRSTWNYGMLAYHRELHLDQFLHLDNCELLQEIFNVNQENNFFYLCLLLDIAWISYEILKCYARLMYYGLSDTSYWAPSIPFHIEYRLSLLSIIRWYSTTNLIFIHSLCVLETTPNELITHWLGSKYPHHVSWIQYPSNQPQQRNRKELSSPWDHAYLVIIKERSWSSCRYSHFPTSKCF